MQVVVPCFELPPLDTYLKGTDSSGDLGACQQIGHSVEQAHQSKTSHWCDVAHVG